MGLFAGDIMATIYKDVPHLAHQSNDAQKHFEIRVSRKDREVLRELGKKTAEIASDPKNEARKELWTRMNQLEDGKPMVWMNEVCWNEMDVDDELKLMTGNDFCQRIEIELRQNIYQWKHMPCDMVMDPAVYSPLIVENTGFGIRRQEDTIVYDEDNTVVSHRFHPQIRSEEDIEKIVFPKITHHAELSAKTFDAYRDIFDGVLKVEMIGSPGFWFAPWDMIVGWTGVQEALLDLAMRPDYIQRLVDHLCSAYLHALDQYQEQNLLALNNRNVRIGSGAYGYTTELPAEGYEPARVRTQDIWGAATAQIFSEVSPEMHEEFALQYERRWLRRFGLTYYGCCEPLHKKIDVLRSIPNLRKISVSPWVDMEEAVSKIGGDYVVSLKPSPAVLATDSWNLEAAKKDLKEKLDIARRHGCSVEVIMKDISTVRYEPQRLWEWAEMASTLCKNYV
jgi:hypothetical protein